MSVTNRAGRAALLLLTTAAPAALTGQVGFRPDASPYRDIRIRQTITATSAYLSGGTGQAGVAPSNGFVTGLRWDFHVGGAATIFTGAGAGQLERILIDPDNPPETRLSGTAMQSILMADAGANLIFTGRKTWHGVAPYIGATVGVVFSGTVPEDSSGFSFKNKFHVEPNVGVRWFLNRRVHVRVEATDILWRVTYPSRFFDPPANDPTATPVLDGRVTTGAEWVHHPTLRVGLGYSIRL